MLGERQHGVLARWQLLELGFDASAIYRAVRSLRLLPVHRGVFAVGRRRLDLDGRWMAACLAAGRPAILADRCGAHLLGMTDRSPERCEVITPGARHPHPTVSRRRAALEPDEVTSRRGIPVTTPIRTLVDLAGVVSRDALERALARGMHRGDVWPKAVEQALDRYAGRRGIAALREVHTLGNATLGVTAGRFEDRFLRWLDRHGIRRPRLNVPLDLSGTRIRVDCLWAGERVACELDTRAWHGDWVAAESDRTRDRLLSAHGYRPIRVTPADLDRRGDRLARDLRAILD